jgi:hypothetical protein
MGRVAYSSRRARGQRQLHRKRSCYCWQERQDAPFIMHQTCQDFRLHPQVNHIVGPRLLVLFTGFRTAGT